MANGRADTTDYARLFLEDTPMLDTRAPLEFARGAFPTAHNIPLMSDDERAAVGTCYKRRGQEAAIELGHELVSGSVKEERLQAWLDFAQAHPEGYLYCFRGGLRSQIVQQWLLEAGVEYPRIGGGYKAMRRFLIDALNDGVADADIVLVAGATGTGKTRLIQNLPRHIDLEGLAHHRGSAFGRLLDPQPSQIDFENGFAIALMKLLQSPGPVMLEDEGRLIGRLALPENLRTRMAQAPLLVLESSLAERIEVVVEDYILDLGARFAATHGADGPALHRERLLGDLYRTRKRLGSERHREIASSMEDAFAAQARSGDLDGHRYWIGRLLAEYYDPMYDYQLSRREGKILARGDRASLADYVRSELVDGA